MTLLFTGHPMLQWNDHPSWCVKEGSAPPQMDFNTHRQLQSQLLLSTFPMQPHPLSSLPRRLGTAAMQRWRNTDSAEMQKTL